MREDVWKNENLVKTLNEGGVAVMPTDTLYGIVGRAEEELTVKRIYGIRKRNPAKPCIILIGGTDDLKNFSVHLSAEQTQETEKYWPGPVSIVLPCTEESLQYLHRGTNTLAFRLPASSSLRDLLRETGPLIAPSANPEGLTPASTTLEAQNYFGNSVDLYVDGGELYGKPSKVIKLHSDSSVTILRE